MFLSKVIPVKANIEKKKSARVGFARRAISSAAAAVLAASMFAAPAAYASPFAGIGDAFSSFFEGGSAAGQDAASAGFASGNAPAAASLEAESLAASASSPLYDRYKIKTVSPSGTTINLFDYWVTDETRYKGDYRLDPRSETLINESHQLWFTTGAGGVNAWTGSVKPRSGMVEPILENGYPALRSTDEHTTSHGGPLKHESLAYLFDAAPHPGKEVHSNVGALLEIDENGYFSYDSKKNFASYNEATNSFDVYNTWGVEKTGNSPNGQFFPFNTADQVFKERKDGEPAEKWGKPVQDDGINSRTDNINHYFGMSMTTRFVQRDGGKAGDRPVRYEFSGDDDVWVYIDDVLVADLGGIHDAASVDIDFSTGDVRINGKKTTTLKKAFERAGKRGPASNWSGDTFADKTYHALKFFYLERGNSDSNMKLKFNLVSVPESNAVKVSQHGDFLSGAKMALYATGPDYAVDGSADMVATGTTDIDGTLLLTGEHDEPLTFTELYTRLGKEHFVVREIDPPAGYRKLTKDIHVRYSPLSGVVYCENVWDTAAHVTGRALIDAPAHMSLADQGSLTVEEGTLKYRPKGSFVSKTGGRLFAVVLHKDGASSATPGVWRAVYGHALNGEWKLTDSTADGYAAILESLKHSGGYWEFRPNSSGVYEADIKELPGDIRKYYRVMTDEGSAASTAEYALGFYYTSAATIEGANASNTHLVVDPEAGDNAFFRQYSGNFYIPNVKNRVLVQKVDEQGNPINGVRFALKKEDGTTVKELETRTQSREEGDIVNADGMVVFGHDASIENGNYFVEEIVAPSGYQANPIKVPVVVNDEGVYADALAEGDGVEVASGVGTLAGTMKQFVSNKQLDTTLAHIKGTLYVQPSCPFEMFGDDKWTKANPERSLRLGYAAVHGGDAAVEYANMNAGESPVILVDEGWGDMRVVQDLTNPDGNPAASNRPYEDLGDKDLTDLFSGSAVIRVENKRTGALEIEKLVSMYEGASVEDTAALQKRDYEFDLKLFAEKPDASGALVALPGRYDVVLKGSVPERLLATVEDGAVTAVYDESGAPIPNAKRVRLSHGETAVVKGLPVGARYALTEEDPGPGFAAPSFKANGGPSSGAKAEGSIDYTDETKSAVETETVVCENAYKPAPAMQPYIVKGKKILTGAELTSASPLKFTFGVKPAAVNPKPDPAEGYGPVTFELSKPTSADAEYSFDFAQFEFTVPGTYEYHIFESSADPIAGISYSQALYHVTVKVSDRDDQGNFTGKLEVVDFNMVRKTDDAGVAPAAGGALPDRTAVFTNTYSKNAAKFTFLGSKVLLENGVSVTPISGEFSFTLTPKGGTGPDGKTVSAKDVPTPKGTFGTASQASNLGSNFIFPSIAFTDADAGWTYVYEVKENAPAADGGGMAYDRNVREVSVKIDKAGGALTVTPTYPPAESYRPALPEGADDPSGAVIFVNAYDPAPVEFALQGKKTLSGRDAADTDVFTFDIAPDLSDAATKAAFDAGWVAMPKDANGADVTSVEVTGQQLKAGNGAAPFALKGFSATHAGTYKFLITERQPAVNPSDGVTYDVRTWRATVAIESRDAQDKPTGSLAVTSMAYAADAGETSDAAAFANAYAATPAKADMAGTKYMDGRPFVAGESYSFQVERGVGNPTDAMPSRVSADGIVAIAPTEGGNREEIDFGSLTFDRPGEYKYVVRELGVDGKPGSAGVMHDTEAYTAVYTVTDDGKGRLVVDANVKNESGYPRPGMVWTNKYSAEGTLASVDMKGEKRFTGRPVTDEDVAKDAKFVFELKPGDLLTREALESGEIAILSPDGSPAPGGVLAATVTAEQLKNGGGSAGFNFEGSIKFTKPTTGSQRYAFCATEVSPEGGVQNDIIYDAAEHLVMISVKDSGDGTLTPAVKQVYVDGQPSADGLVWKNVYDTNLTCGVDLSKTLNGRDMVADQFAFAVTPLDSDTVLAADTAEKLGIDPAGATVKSGAASAGAASVVALFDVKFTTADAGKVYRFEVAEVSAGAPGYGYDGAKRTVAIAPTLAGDVMTVTTTVTRSDAPGELAQFVCTSDGARAERAVVPFVNTYTATGTSVDIEGLKVMDGRDLQGDDFEFTLSLLDGQGVAGAALATVKNAADGTISFKAADVAGLRYDMASLDALVADGFATKATDAAGVTTWTLTYRVAEVTDGLVGQGITAQTPFFDVTVTVTDDNTGALQAAAAYPEEGTAAPGATIVNSYNAEDVAFAPAGKKTLSFAEGLNPADIAGKFEFTLEPVGGTFVSKVDGLEHQVATADVPMPADVAGASATNDAQGMVTFGSLTFTLDHLADVKPAADGTRTKTFVYRVSEAGAADGVTNDPDAKQFTLTLTDNGIGALALSSSPAAPEALFAFVNTYEAQKTSAPMKGAKTIDGRAFVADDAFTFKVERSAGNPTEAMPAGVGADGTATIDPTDGATNFEFDFGAIEFAKPGTYAYTVREVAPAGATGTPAQKDGVTYDAKVYAVEYTVADSGAGALQVVSTKVDGQDFAGALSWTNTYAVAGQAEASFSVTKALEGKKWNGESFAFALTGVSGTLADGTALEQAAIPMPAQTAVEATAPSGVDEAGRDQAAVAFGPIAYDKPGTYVYEVRELGANGTPGAGGTANGITYDSRVAKATVVVSDDGRGGLTADATVENGAFVNTYETDVACGINLSKTLNGRDMAAGQFEFTVTARDEATAAKFGLAAPRVVAAPAAAAGAASVVGLFPDVKFTPADAGKTYALSIVESKVGGEGYVNDTAERTVTVAPSFDDASGVLTVTTTVSVEGSAESAQFVCTSDGAQAKRAVVAFVNSYQAETPQGASTVIEGTKKLVGRDLAQGEFSFQLGLVSVLGDAVEPVGDPVANGADGTFAFPALSYDSAQLDELVAANKATKTVDPASGNATWTVLYRVSELTDALPQGITATTEFFDVMATFADDGRGGLTATLTYPDQEAGGAQIVNTYTTNGESNTVTFAPKGGKVLKPEGGVSVPGFAGGEFEFTLSAQDGAPMPEGSLFGKKTVTNDNLGQVSFGNIEFTLDMLDGVRAAPDGSRSKSFVYQVTESGEMPGVTNEQGADGKPAVKEFTLTLTDDGKGALTVASEPSGSALFTFANTYKPAPVKAAVEASKALTGLALQEGQFTFELLKAGETTPLTATNDANGMVSFDLGEFGAPGVYAYTLREQAGPTDDGITYDTTEYQVTVTVTDDGKGALSLTTEYAKADGTKVDAATFENSYQAKPASVSTDALFSKSIAGRDWLETDSFEFAIAALTQGAPMPKDASGNEVTSVKVSAPADKSAAQSFGFGSIVFDEPGVYEYEVTEADVDSATMPGVGKDARVAKLTVTVTDNKQGELEASAVATIEAKDAAFVNTYTAQPALVTLGATKVLEGRDLVDGEFAFELRAADGTVLQTKANAGGAVTFDALSYSAEGTYEYQIAEVKGTAGGVTYDEAVHAVTVTVTHNPAAGAYVASVAYDGAAQAPVFKNEYAAAPVKADEAITVAKKVESSAGNDFVMKGGEFEFTLSATQVPEGVQIEPKKTLTNDASGAVDFGTLEFAKAGTYVFTLVENDVQTPGVSKDSTAYEITYVVKDVEKAGTLTVTGKTVKAAGKDVGSSTQKLPFVNAYDPGAVAYGIGGVKTIDNVDPGTHRVPADGEFEFTLTAVDGAPMPEGSAGGSKTVKNTGGTFAFGDATYTAPGEYRYTVTEKIPALDSPSYDGTVDYDTSTYDVVVTVSDEGGKLAAKAAVSRDDAAVAGVAFKNGYAPTPTPGGSDEGAVVLGGTKTLTGRDLADGEFEFVLTAVDGAPMPEGSAGGSKVVKNAGAAFDFGTVVFDRVGTYSYTVAEVANGLGGVTYDARVYTATVTVTEDVEAHKLVAAVAYSLEGQPMDGAAFENAYRAEAPATYGLVAAKTLTGRDLADGEFEFTLTAVSAPEGVELAPQQVKRNAADGSVKFDMLSFAHAGTYVFEVAEVAGSAEGVTYDSAVHRVSIEVADNGKGAFEVVDAAFEGGEAPVFRNAYVPPTEPGAPGGPDDPTDSGTPDRPGSPAAPDGSSSGDGLHFAKTNDMTALVLVPSAIAAVAAVVLIVFSISRLRRR